jgi:CHASE2 domain-containing sensor protein
MYDLTLTEALHLGGLPTYISLAAGIVIIANIISGFVTGLSKARPESARRPFTRRTWILLISGFVCALNGSVGTFLGMVNVHRAVAAAGLSAGAVMAQGVFEVLFNVIFGFGFAFLALFGFAALRLIAAEGGRTR